MKLINTFLIAWRNLKRRRRAAFSLGCGVLIITMLVTVWAVFHEGINRIYEDYLSGKKAAFVIERYLELDENGEIKFDSEYREIRRAVKLDACGNRLVCSGECDLVDVLNRKDDLSYFVNMELASMIADGTEYHGINDFSYEFRKMVENIDREEYKQYFTVRFGMYAALSEYFLTENDVTEFEYRFGGSPVLIGKESMEAGDILISDYYLEKFGYPEAKYGELIGKTVTFKVDGAVLLENVRVAGILDRRVFTLNRFYDGATYGAKYDNGEQIVVCCDPETAKYLKLSNIWGRVAVVDYEEARKAFNNAGEDPLMYSYANDAVNMEKTIVINSAKLIVDRVFIVFAAMIAFVAVMHLIATLRKYIGERTAYTGMLRAIGMRRGDVYRVSYAELLIITFICVIVSVPAAAGLFKVFSGIMFKVLSTNTNVSLGMFTVIAVTIALSVSVFVYLVEFPMLRRVVRKQPALLMQEDESK